MALTVFSVMIVLLLLGFPMMIPLNNVGIA